ncbi:MAG: RAMP superfamily CRISPR-associated protein, partial [Desulfovibrionaceae bacterium]|nr:RAMP superfamily CRISPR-associated protein [Desulfovibrionaceae bacterium]
MHAALSVTFLSDWLIASGLGDGVLADAVLVRDHDGLPWIPGRALKGALREGAHRLAQARPDLKRAENLFWGTRNTELDTNRSGLLRVSAARLPDSLRQALREAAPEEREALVRDLTVIRRQTALDERGNTIDHSLRASECGMAGLTFTAELDLCLPEDLDL